MRFRKLLRAAGLTLIDAARKAGVSKQTVHNWRQHPATATAGRLSELARVLGVTVDELLRVLREDAKHAA